MNQERRTISKTFRMTPSLLTLLKNYQKMTNTKQSEGDVINEALTDYLNTYDMINKTKIDNAAFNKSQTLSSYEYTLKKAEKLLAEYEDKHKTVINSASDVVKYLKALMPLDHEVNYALYLDSHNKLIETVKMDEGTRIRAVAEFQKIFKQGIILNAWQIIMVHNHPSGSVKPSDADIKTSRLLFFGCNYNGMTLSDFIIIGKNKKYYSFEEEGFIRVFQKTYKKTQTKIDSIIK